MDTCGEHQVNGGVTGPGAGGATNVPRPFTVIISTGHPPETVGHEAEPRAAAALSLAPAAHLMGGEPGAVPQPGPRSPLIRSPLACHR